MLSCQSACSPGLCVNLLAGGGHPPPNCHGDSDLCSLDLPSLVPQILPDTRSVCGVLMVVVLDARIS